MTEAEDLALVRLTCRHYADARRARDAAIARAMSSGALQRDVAEAAGLTPSAVRKIATQEAQR